MTVFFHLFKKLERSIDDPTAPSGAGKYGSQGAAPESSSRGQKKPTLRLM